MTSLFPSARPSLQVRASASYPAGVKNGAGIRTLLQNGVIRTDLDYSGLMPTNDFEEGGKFVAAFNVLTGQYEKREVTSSAYGPLTAEDYKVIPIQHPKYAEWGGYAGNLSRWQALVAKAAMTGRPIHLGRGEYHIRSLDWPANVSLSGMGEYETTLKFAGGHSEDLIRFPLPAAMCDNLLFAPVVWRDLTIDFNGTQQASGRGIVVKGPEVSGFYGTAPVFIGVRMWNALGDTLTYEFGRNMVRLYDCRIRAGQANGVVLGGSMDCKIDRCYISEHYSGINLYYYAGSGLNVSNSHIFSGKNNLVKMPSAYDGRFYACDFDRAEEDAVVLYGNATGRDHNIIFDKCTFVYSSHRAGSSGVYSDIRVNGGVNLVVDSANISYYGAAHESITRCFIEFQTWSGFAPLPARITNLQYDVTAASSLWALAFTNDFTLIRGNMNEKFGLAPTTAGGVRLLVNNTAVWNYEASYSYTHYAAYFYSGANFVNNSAATDEKKWVVSTSSHNGKNVAGFYLKNDAESAVVLGLAVKRSSSAFLTLTSGPLPTSATGLASGDYWCDAAAGNVVKQVP